MKKITIAVLAIFILYGCTDKKAQEKAVLDEVIKVHDKVMDADGQLMANKMKLDTLLKQSNLSGKDTAVMMDKKLDAAENAMETWMHNFDPDHAGKSHAETMAYMNSQKKQITAIDSQLNAVITQSTQYLSKIKTK